MKLVSLDGSMTLCVAAPGMGFSLTLDGHVWLFNRDGVITASVPPLITAEQIALDTVKHRVAASSEACPGCSMFVDRNKA